ncbi:MAG TPA: hypothetical protein DCD98_10230 [Syntrophomonas sp.]|nr:hypothetical protein [Syntrophomonas sp.]
MDLVIPNLTIHYHRFGLASGKKFPLVQSGPGWCYQDSGQEDAYYQGFYPLLVHDFPPRFLPAQKNKGLCPYF